MSRNWRGGTVCFLQRIYSNLEELIQHHQGQGSKQGSISVTSNQPLSYLRIQQYRFLKWIDLFYHLKPKYPSVSCDMMTSDQEYALFLCMLCIGQAAHVQNASSELLQWDIYIWLWKEQSRRLKACPVAGLGIVFEQWILYNNDFGKAGFSWWHIVKQ